MYGHAINKTIDTSCINDQGMFLGQTNARRGCEVSEPRTPSASTCSCGRSVILNWHMRNLRSTANALEAPVRDHPWAPIRRHESQCMMWATPGASALCYTGFIWGCISVPEIFLEAVLNGLHAVVTHVQVCYKSIIVGMWRSPIVKGCKGQGSTEVASRVFLEPNGKSSLCQLLCSDTVASEACLLGYIGLGCPIRPAWGIGGKGGSKVQKMWQLPARKGSGL